MGLARHNPRGQTRLGLSATAGSAVLYGAIVVFGIGSASPSALDVGGDRHGSVVLVAGHADIVPGSVKKLPQASAEPGRHRSHTRARQRGTGVAPAETSAPSTVADPTPKSPQSPRVTESAPSAAGSTPVSVSDPPLVVTVPLLPVPAETVPLPELPVPVPELPAPQPPLTLPLP